MIIGVKAEFAANKIPKNRFPRFIYKIVTNKIFETFIMVCIVLNIVSMGLTYEGSPPSYDLILEDINYFFTSTFILELILKLISYGFEGFWMSGWNKFDLFVVISSICDLVLNSIGSGISFLRIGP